MARLSFGAMRDKAAIAPYGPYAYVGGNSVNWVDSTGQNITVGVIVGGSVVIVGATISPAGQKAVSDAAKAAAQMCSDVVDKVRNWYEQRHSPDQEALDDIIKDVTNRGNKPVSDTDADTLLDWGKEVGSDVRDDRDADHWVGGPHIHIPGVVTGHIPVKK